MQQNFHEFKKYFNKPFWKAFSTALPIFGEIKNKDEIVRSLYNEIQSRSYYPSIPKAYIYNDKGNSVTRSIPVFEIKDYCLFYYCIKRLEDKIAVNRVENTFGGWSLGGEIRKTEETEIAEKAKQYQDFEDQWADMNGVSIVQYSFDPVAWSKAYGDFNGKLYSSCKEERFIWSVEFDIANFYDCIRLDLLEIWIREISEKETSDEVALLFHFLNYWNRQTNSYNKQTVGVPQDAFADCSRILANFYLQEYDKYTYNLCRKNKCRYLRYADDQFIFGESKEQLEYIIFLLSRKLNCYGLNINQKKIEYRLVEDLIYHRSFKIFDYVFEDDSQKPECIEAFIDAYFELKDKDQLMSIKDRGLSLLNKACSLDLKSLKKAKRVKILKCLLQKDYLRRARANNFKRIYELLNTKKDRENFLNLLGEITDVSFHNSFHYEVMKFYISVNIDTEKLRKRIKEIE